MFSQKTAEFCFLINFKFKKVLASLHASFALSKNKNSEPSRLIVRTLPSPHHSQCYIPLSAWCILFIYTIFISIICVSQEELSLIASNEQIYDFYNWAFFLTENAFWKVKKQDIKNRSGGEGWRQQEKVFRQNLVGQVIKGDLHNIGVVRNPLPTMNHKDLFWKKDVLIV